MIPQQYQAASMQVNPQLARSIEETVTNLKNLEYCIDSLRNDLAVVAESTGNTQALQRLLTPTQIPSATAGAQAPWAAQPIGQFASASASPAAFPIGGIGDPYETGLNPYAQASAAPFAPTAGIANPAIAPYAAVNPASAQYAATNPAAFSAPHAQAYAPQAVQMRQAELARHAALAPWATATTPFAHQAAYARSAVAPWAAQTAHLAARAPYAAPHLSATPFAHQQISHLGAQSPFAHQQVAPQEASTHQQVPQYAAQSPIAQQGPAARQLAAASLNPGVSVGPF